MAPKDADTSRSKPSQKAVNTPIIDRLISVSQNTEEISKGATDVSKMSDKEFLALMQGKRK